MLKVLLRRRNGGEGEGNQPPEHSSGKLTIRIKQHSLIDIEQAVCDHYHIVSQDFITLTGVAGRAVRGLGGSSAAPGEGEEEGREEKEGTWREAEDDDDNVNCGNDGARMVWVYLCR